MFCINTFTFVFSLLWHWLMPEQCCNHWRMEVRLDPCGTVIILSGGSNWVVFSLRRVVSSETAARGVHESSLGMLCAGGGRWDVVITPLMCILPHSSWSLQSILGFAVCTPLFPVKEVHEYPSILWLKSLFSGGPLKQPWLWRLWLSSPIPPSFSVFSKSFFQSFLLASSLCTVWLADPKVLCV